MGMTVSSVAALSTIYPEARNVRGPEARALQIQRLIGKVPTIAAYTYRHSLGYPYVYLDNDLAIPKISSTCCRRWSSRSITPIQFCRRLWMSCLFCMPITNRLQH